MESTALALASVFAAVDVQVREGPGPGMSVTHRPDALLVFTLRKTRIDLRRVNALKQWRL